MFSRIQRRQLRLKQRRATGFTLVEMLISVALVLIMMAMFAEVFQIAGGSISRMRGMAENDQRARTLQTVIKSDLDKRTFRWIYPFAANENTGVAGANIGQRQGYFYISENNPYNALDDVLQFTVMSTLTMRNTDVTPYYGQALNMAPMTYPNQPDADDAQILPNNTGSSTAAEISYFVRNGNLYRRQLLIREPLSIAGTNPQPTDETISNQGGNNVFALTPPVPVFQYSATGPFWNDFDYSAYYTTNGATFLGPNSLNNSSTGAPIGIIANPAERFGFSPSGAGIIAGRPKEFVADTGTADLNDFIGRFTLEECSDPNFRYPQNLAVSTGGTKYIPTDPSYALTLDKTLKFVTDFENGPRRGEDLIMANVHAFDIQVWDERAQAFVNLCDPSLTATGSDYAFGNRYSNNLGTPPSLAYGPRITENAANNATNAVYDTWHPQLDLDTTNDPSPSPNIITGQTVNDDPPFRPVYARPASLTGNASDVQQWKPATQYALGAVVFPSGPPGTYLANLYPSNGYAPPPANPTKLPYGFPFFYRCVQAGLSGSTSNSTYPAVGPFTPNPANLTDYSQEPSWPQVEGATIIDQGTNNYQWGPVIWQAIDNRKPLKAIKITIRFFDTSSQQMRQLTIVQSLVD